jgi:hypothetical protein
MSAWELIIIAAVIVFGTILAVALTRREREHPPKDI